MTKVSKKTNNSDLEALQNKGETIQVDGETIEVKPFTFGQLLKALKHLANIGSSFSLDEMNDSLMLQALALHADDVLQLLMLATGKNKEFFDTLAPDVGIDIAMAAWRVNQDFFVQKLAPKIQQIQESVGSPKDPTKTENSDLKAGSASSTT